MDSKEKKTYTTPNIGVPLIVAVVPFAAVAPLAILSAKSAVAFAVGLAGGAAATAVATSAMGKILNHERTKTLPPIE